LQGQPVLVNRGSRMTNVISLPMRNDEDFGKAGEPRCVFDFTLYIGVVLSVALPEVIFSFYFGWLAAAVFTLCFLVAGALGLGMYFNPPVTVHSCVPTVLSSDSEAANTLRLAA
jgi:hypothetical protein